jgi:large subunit ribosomal protein L29
MAKVKKEDIKELSTPELVERVKEEKELITKLQFNHAVSPIENPNLIRESKRNVARLLTELNLRNEQSADTAPAPAKAEKVEQVEEKKEEKPAKEEAKTEE